MKRTIPRSQAIYPYGPGAILDWGQECFVVLDTRGEGWRRAPKISLTRLQNRLGATDGFRLPPVVKDGYAPLTLDVQRFPGWLFCPRCRRMWRWDRQKEVKNKGNVPRCLTCSGGSVLVPMRYLAVCDNGHLADVDWHRWAHAESRAEAGPCDPRRSELFFDAAADKGATLEALTIRCGTCDSRRSLREILNPGSLKRIGQRCWGRQPWQSKNEEIPCPRDLMTLQRSQTAVHYADIVSAIDLSAAEAPEQSDIERIAQEVIRALTLDNIAEAEAQMRFFVRKASAELGRSVAESEITPALAKIFGAAIPTPALNATFDDAEILKEEWDALTTPSADAAVRAPLIVRRESSEDGAQAPGIRAVYLVERLREVRALRGFRRVRPDGTLVRPDVAANPQQRWLPATEVFGEGVFIEFSLPAVAAWERKEDRALNRRLRTITDRLRNGEGPVKRFAHLAGISARFMLVHTFSHLLMRQLCYECGYGGASIRERVYVFEDRAGVLIYTADGDSEGSMGGLVRQGRSDRLPRTILSALERASWCSNDPICREVPEHGFEKLDLAACHACALAPETSCTHLNALLDRELVVSDGSSGFRGFFTDFLAERSSR